MKLPFFLDNLRSNYCKIIFGLSLFVGYALTPKNVLTGLYLFLAVPFIFLFALTLSCAVRSVKEKIKVTRHQQTSIFGVIASAIGISALQVCGVGTPLCGASVGISILSAIFPSLVLNILREYSVVIISMSILTQLISLHSMNCLSFYKNSSQRRNQHDLPNY